MYDKIATSKYFSDYQSPSTSTQLQANQDTIYVSTKDGNVEIKKNDWSKIAADLTRKPTPNELRIMQVSAAIEKEIERLENRGVTDKAGPKAQAIRESLTQAINQFIDGNCTMSVEEFLHFKNDPQSHSISDALKIKQRTYDFINTPTSIKNVTAFKERINKMKDEEIQSLETPYLHGIK